MTDFDFDGLTDAQQRLFAVRCARRVQHLMTDPRSLAALDVVERHAKGEATDEELATARYAAWEASWAEAGAAATAEAAAWVGTGPAAGAAWAAATAAACAAAGAAADAVTWAAWATTNAPGVAK